MYTDAVVIAGIGTVLLMLGFLAGVAIFVMKDAKRQLGDHGRRSDKPAGEGSKT